MPYDEEQESEMTLLDVFSLMWRMKWLIIFLTALFGGIATYRALTSPVTYRAECRVLVQGGSGGGSSQCGGMAAFMGFPGSVTVQQMMISILQGDSVVDAVIDKFNIMKETGQTIRLAARSSVLLNLVAEELPKSGIISVAYVHVDPNRAADMANAFVDELQKKLQELSIADAQQKRAFFETQLLQAQQELNTAEADLINYQQTNGVIAFESQTSALLSSINTLRNRIADKNVEISSLKSYARRDNPTLRLAQSELEAMTLELRKLEEEQQKTDSRGKAANGDPLSSIGQLPELGVEYQRYTRNLQFATAKYELMLKQYENARMSEVNDISTIQIIDYATPPDLPNGPRRKRMILMGAGGGFVLGLFMAFVCEHIRVLRKARRERGEDYDDD